MGASADRRVGLGLRPPYHAAILGTAGAGPDAGSGDGPVDIDFVEVITENVLVQGGNPRAVLRAVRERMPVALHGVSLAVGNVDPLDRAYLRGVRALADEVDPFVVSDHLCWGGVGGHVAHDLWPLPLTEESLAHVAARVHAVQELLGRPLTLENASTYVEFAGSTVPEAEFLAALCARTGCTLLVDVNNVFVSSSNHGWDARAWFAAIPAASVVQYHLAGHRVLPGYRLDSHDEPVCAEVWDLYAHAVATLGPRPTLVEWDARFPPLAVYVAQAHEARARMLAGAP